MKNESTIKMVGSSESDEWLTPILIADRLAKLEISLDPCSHPLSLIRASVSYDIRNGEDGLARGWSTHTYDRKIAFVNPPYSDLARWIEKASRYPSIMLCPARTETKAFHAHVWPSARVLFLDQRLRYLETVDGEIARIDKISAAAAKRLSIKIEKAIEDGVPLIEGDSSPHSSVIVDWSWRDDVYEAFKDIGVWVAKIDP